MKTMLAVLMMSCTVFAEPPSAEVQDGAEAVLTLYNRLLGQKPSDPLSAKPLDPRLVLVTGAGDFGENGTSVIILMFGKTAFVAVKKGEGVAVVAVCGRDNIIKLADSLAEPSFFTKYGVAPVPTCGKSELKVYAVAEPVLSDYVYFSVSSQIGNVRKIEAETYRNVAKEMSDALRHYIPLSGGVLDSSELLMSTHAEVSRLKGVAKKLREQGKHNDALKVLDTAIGMIDESFKTIKGKSMSLSFASIALDMEIVLIGMQVKDKVVGTNATRRVANELVERVSNRGSLQRLLMKHRHGLLELLELDIDAQAKSRIRFGIAETERLEKLEESGTLQFPLALEMGI